MALKNYPHKRNKNMKKIKLWAVVFWLAVWEAASLWLDKEILLVSPIKVLARLGTLSLTTLFWKSIAYSLIRIGSGFLLSVGVGVALAALSAKYKRVGELLAPLMLAVKSVPVVSFIILALIWFSSRNLAVLISFMMVLPIIYTNTLKGINSLDKEMGEMARVFGLSLPRRVRYIYMPQIMPFFYAGCEVGLGLCWKSGVAAEVIGMPRGSIGERLFQSKVYLDTPDLFAWTVVIVVISFVFERIMLGLLRRFNKGCERM
jgi:NitT/TauT family transport system permease protein